MKYYRPLQSNKDTLTGNSFKQQSAQTECFDDKDFIWNRNSLIGLSSIEKQQEMQENVHLEQIIQNHFRVIKRCLNQLENQSVQFNVKQKQKLELEEQKAANSQFPDEQVNFSLTNLKKKSSIERCQIISELTPIIRSSQISEEVKQVFIRVFKQKIKIDQSMCLPNIDLLILAALLNFLKTKINQQTDLQYYIQEILNDQSTTLEYRLNQLIALQEINSLTKQISKLSKNVAVLTQQVLLRIIKILAHSFYLLNKGIYQTPYL